MAWGSGQRLWCLGLPWWLAVAGGGAGGPDGSPILRRTIEEALKAHTDRLMSIPGVVGTAQSLCDGKPCVKVFVDKKTPELLKEIPATVDGYAVRVEETGEFRPFSR